MFLKLPINPICVILKTPGCIFCKDEVLIGAESVSKDLPHPDGRLVVLNGGVEEKVELCIALSVEHAHVALGMKG